MKSTSVGEFYIQRWSRLARHVIVLGTVAIGVMVRAQTYGVSLYAGQNLTAGNADAVSGPPTAATFSTPKGIAIDGSGNIYVADAANNEVRKITASSGAVSTLATGLANPGGIAVDGSGNLYVADTGHHTIVKIPSGGSATIIAGASGTLGYLDNATGTSARFFNPTGITVDSGGTVAYVADTSNQAIRKITLSGSFAVQTIAGCYTGSLTTTGATGVSGTADGVALTNDGSGAKFNAPYSVALSTTLIYVADRNNSSIRKVDLSNLATASGVTTFAGTSGTPGSTDGSATGAALFKTPEGVTADGSGNVFVSDSGNATIRKIASGTVSTIAGSAGSLGTADGVSTSARFQEPFGIGVTSGGLIFVSDAANQNIRKLAVTVAPALSGPVASPSATVTAGNNVTLTVTLTTGSPAPTLTWKVKAPTDSGFSTLSIVSPYSLSTDKTALTITSVPVSLNGYQYEVLASNGVSPDYTTTPITLAVNQAPALNNATTSTNFTAGVASQTFLFTATGQPAPDLSIASGNFPSSASLSQSKSGTTTTGTVTWSPQTSDLSGSPYVFTVKAHNGVGTDATQQFTINVITGPTIATQPSAQSVSLGNTATFSAAANANGGGTLSYKWQVSSDNGSSWTDLSEGSPYSGTQTSSLSVVTSAALNAYKFRIVVTNTLGSATSNAATLTVTQTPAFTSTSTTTFVTGQNNSYQVSASGSPAPTFSIVSGTFPGFATLLDGGTGTATLSGTPSTSDATSSPYNFTIQATSVAGTTTQSFSLVVSTAPAAPVITTPPGNATVQLGANVTFTAAATGNPTPTLQWQRQPAGTSGFVNLADDSTFSGTATGTLTITATQAGMTGDQFRLVATNTNGTATSNAGSLTVNIGTAITTFAGQPGLFGSIDGTGTAARFNTPAAIAYDASSGSFYVADAANHVIRKISAGGVVTTVAGTAGVSGNVDGTGAAARFNGPSAIAVDSAGNIYVADTYNQTIRMVTSAGAVTTLAGLANNSGTADGTGTAARFNLPSGIAVDTISNVYVADTSNHTIRKVTITGVVTTIAGSPGVTGSTDASGSSARFYYPEQLALDSSGSLYIADSFNHTIRKIASITSGGTTVQTVAGTAGSAGSTDANGTSARFNQPIGVAVDSAGNVYVADTYNNTIRKIAVGGAVTTMAGAPAQSGAADGIGDAARFYQPFGLTVDANGNLYIADTRNQTIRRSGTTTAPAITTQPANRLGTVGGNVSFTVAASGVPAPSYQWQRQPFGGSGFSNLANDTTYSGANSATLTISNLFSAYSGDQFRVIITNGISPAATSDTATLSIGTAPAFTSANSATFQAGVAGSFTAAASGSPSPTFSTTGTVPSWLSLNASTGVLSGTPPIDATGQYAFTLVANNGLATTQSFTLTVTPGAPTITAQPAGVTVNQGGSATFSVTATGASPFSYQWRRNGISISGATDTSLTLTNIQPAVAGNYSVVVTNAAGVLASNDAALVVNTLPTFTVAPQPQTVLAGSNVTFSVTAGGGSGFTYQWRKNGVAIAGATGSTLTLTAVTAADVASYDVIVTDSVGSSTSSIAQLTIVTAPFAPVVTSQPRSQTALVGSSVTLSVAGNAVPSPTLQWRKNGVAIPGANSNTYVIGTVQSSDAGNYDVIATNSVGTVTSAAATLRVIARSYAGTYFGSLGGGLGNFALYVRDDNTGVFLAYLPGSTAAIVNLNVQINDAGQFQFSQNSTVTATATDSMEPPRAAALGAVTLNGTIGADGTLFGSVFGGANASLSGSRSADTGPTQPVAGFYQAGSGNSGTSSYTVAGANSTGFVVVQTGASADGGSAVVTSAGQVTAVTGRSIISETITPSSGTVTGTSSGGLAASFAGGSDVALSRQRLVNISSRARVGSGDSVAIAGFVISGTDSKPVLIRAVGPTLSVFGLTGVLATPKLDLYRGSTVIASNVGVASSPNFAAITAAGRQAGAFDLGSSGNDSALLITLAPGAYTAQVSSTTGTPGTALVEVYDLSAPAAGQKLLDISTRAQAGTADATLIAGFVVPAGPAKRVLIRGIGPGLAQFGLTGTLAQPTLTLLNGSNIVASNTNFTTSADAAAITSGATQVGAFTLANGDSAMIVTLAPGNYTAQVTGATSATGIALVEVYELP